jgi:hypothetical protein
VGDVVEVVLDPTELPVSLKVKALLSKVVGFNAGMEPAPGIWEVNDEIVELTLLVAELTAELTVELILFVTELIVF